ncbi:DUF3341 domain-containing protein [Flavobacterium johnsoniae]|uniref:Quinol:cytochrome c oxidoreductase membrane protein n=1 Tax=Flavobacterium johnsoniae (strain ATCC 17061 / DSM 2064 / JCM 8514 / BCRC 14874 / CCUG 350202 / NBRC 14942 / NCIMB 11054 / UW101) TaxID=376686 RepID=A5FJF4_FLAJ1|nr:DUF3341 domain-containing protein [Flavobacterium johnsoniae]6BTM_D Chain D, Alternative Complex III subunit D [Flavobacterium johnsoniae UW101]ABQ04669.1 hypothetical protein Fjoh_1637 [Flavobacterium johnsoniae UW101]OXE97990.1 hypothetical protein B0A63_17845 [Flavobacterium johnsoniae UW101]WQG83534.1 DUF3341 domain-containing protein [Flavobacterium johnsoniae UW101]SHK30002.1 quinol:cytochrome c oxidoreductase membrane protein [Flavobacterium johnsoniae]
MSNKVIYAIYNDDDVLMNAVKKTRAAHHHIEEVFTPFPVHGLDKAMGLAPTRLAICAFLYGCVGISVATTMMSYIMIHDWPQDIGGKPSFSFIQNMPSFVPIMFEMTVFFAAHLMVITFYMRSRLWPFKQAENPDVRTTDDHFLIEVAVNDNEAELVSFFEGTGAVEVKVIEKN